MRYNVFQKTCAIILTLVMVIGILPAEVIAEGMQALGDGSSQIQSGQTPQINTDILQPDSDEDSIVDNLPIGEKIYLENGLVLQVNMDGKTLTVVDFMDVKATFVQIPDSHLGMDITRIGDLAFKGKTALTEVILSDNIQYIGDDVFSGCTNLEFAVENGAKYIRSTNNDHFYLHSAVDQNITECEIHEDTRIIASYAFHNCVNLKEIVIPDSVIQVGFRALRGCDNLESVTLPFAGEVEGSESNSHVGFVFGARTYGGNISFVPTSLKKLVIKRGALQKNALFGLDSVQHLGLPSMQQPLGYYYGGETYEDNIAYIPAALTSVEVASGDIPDYAFYNCVNLSKIEMPGNANRVGFAALQDCDSLTELTIPFVGEALDGSGASYFGYTFGSTYTFDTQFFVPSLKAVKVLGGTVEGNAFYGCRSLERVIIAEGVVGIGTSAFSACTNISEISLPDSVTSIGRQAFADTAYYAQESNWTDGALYIDNHLVACRTNIGGDYVVREGTVSIADETFRNLTALTSVIIPKGVKKIGEYLFSGCTGLTYVEIPEGVISIGRNAFERCSKLTAIVFPESLEQIGANILYGCTGIESITLPFIGYSKNNESNAYFSCLFGGYSQTQQSRYIPASLTSVKITGDVTIPDYAFYGCSRLKSIELGEKVTGIGAYAFYGCTGLEEMVIPNSVKQIGEWAFYGCSGLKEIIIPDSVIQLDRNSFGTCTGMERAVIGRGVTVIGASAFGGCTSLVNVEICNPDVVEIKEYAFSGCSSLKQIDLPESTKISSIGYYAFDNCTSLAVAPIRDGLTYIGSLAFYNCDSLTSVHIPNSVTTLSNSAFSGCDGLETVTVGNGISQISFDTFENLISLREITIPGTVDVIGGNAFNNCASLERIIFKGTYAQWKAVQKDYNWDANTGEYVICCTDATVAKDGTVIEGNVEEDTGEQPDTDAQKYSEGLRYSAYGSGTCQVAGIGSCTDTDIVIPRYAPDGKEVVSIGYGAFRDCADITSVVIPDSVTYISYYAFSGCTSLTSIVIPDSVTSIGSYAFSGCTSLTSVVIPDSVTSISTYAFSGCTSLTSIVIPGSVTTVSESAFSGCTSLTDIVILDGVTKILKSAFSGCTSLTSITIPNSVTEISESAFEGCTNLAEIKIANIPISVHVSAFKNTAYYDDPGNWVDGVLYIGNHLIKVDPTIEGAYTVKEGTCTIASYAFEGCKGLTSVVIPESVVSIGMGAFSGCSALEEITIPFVGGSKKARNSTYQYPFGYIFGTTSYDGGTGTTQYYYGSSASSTTSTIYYIPSSLKSVVVLGGNIVSGAFYNCSGLTNITLTGDVGTIEGNAFYNCSGLKSMVIPAGISNIYSGAFAGCYNLESITLPFVGTYDNTLDGPYGYPFGYIFGTSSYTNSVAVTQQYYSGPSAYLSSGTYYIPAKLVSVTILGGNLAYGAFYNCARLTNISLGDQVKEIGQYAFYNCTGLKNMIVPDSVTAIGAYAFSGCSNLESMTLPFVGDSKKEPSDTYQYPFGYIFGIFSYSGSVSVVQYYYGSSANTTTSTTYYIPKSLKEVCITGDYVSSGAFYNCTNITKVTMTDNMQIIGDYAFYGCTGLEEVVMANHVTVIGDYAFYLCSAIEHMEIPDTVASIGMYAFYRCTKINSLTLGDDLLFIEQRAFYDCDGITHITIPNSVKTIGDYAFGDCDGLTSISIPDNVISIGNSAFSYCDNLTDITIANGIESVGTQAFYNTAYYRDASNWRNDILYIGDYLIQAKTSLSDNLVIGSNIVCIASGAFASCKNLTTVSFEEGTLLRSIGSRAFAGTGLSIINYPSEENAWRFIQKATDWDGGITGYTINCADNGALLYEMSDDRREFYVGDYSGKSENANIPQVFSGRPVTQIYEKAFFNADDLQTVTVPETIHYMGPNVFYNCPDLTEIIIEGSDLFMERGMIYGCEALTSLTVPFVGQTITDETYAYLGHFFGADNYRDNENYVPMSLKKVTLTDVTAVSAHSFEDCRYLQEINLPDTLVSIGESAFVGCESLEEEWTLPSSLRSIEKYAFASCNSLTAIILPEGLKSIGKYAFSNCISLQELAIPDSVDSIGEMLLDNCNNVKKITIGAGVTSIPDTDAGNPVFGLNKAVSSLTQYIVSPENTSFATDDRGVLYELHPTLILGQAVAVAVIDAPAKANLKDYVLPEHIVYIAPYAFAYNTTLRWIQLDRVRRIDKCAFLEATSLVAAVFGQEGKLDEEAEQYAQQYDAYIADKIREGESYSQVIGDQAFFGCSMLQYVNLWTDFIVAIGQEAFYDCDMLTSVRLNESVRDIGQRAFGETSLESITVDENNIHYVDFDHVLYEKLDDGTYKLLLFPSHKTVESEEGNVEYQTVFQLPEGVAVSVVESYAFQNAEYLQQIILDPSNKMLVGDYAFQGADIQTIVIGENVTSLGLIRGEGEYTVFEGCEHLSGIEVEKENPYYSSEGGVLFDKGQTKLIKYPYLKAGREYSLPDTVSVIASMAFKGNKNLVNVVIPSYIYTVGLEAFYDCSNLATIYFDHVYAPVSVLENAFTTNTEAGATTRALLCYTGGYHENGSQGELGWKNYAGIYPLYESNVIPSYNPEMANNVYYAIVVVDSSGMPIDGAKVSLTDPNGDMEVITAAGGIAMFYLYGTAGAGFAASFEDTYALTVTDPSGSYHAYTNPDLYLDEDMLITYVTLTRLPTAYGVSCDGMDINSQRAELNKSNIDFTDVRLDEKGNILYAADGKTPLFEEVVEISVIGYCDGGYAFVDADGNVLDDSCGLYQNGVRIASVDRTEQTDGAVIFYFRPAVADLVNEVDIEARLTAVHDTQGSESCSTVLNIHVFDFVIDKSEINLDEADVNIDLGAAGEFISSLFGEDGLELPLGENVKLSSTLEGDVITFGIKGSKELNEKKKKINADYEQGFKENIGNGKETYRFQYTAVFVDKDGEIVRLRYNISFTRETEDSGYYYYRCNVHDLGAGKQATDKNLIATFYGLVNKPSWGGSDDRSAAKDKADLIFVLHYAYILTKCEEKDDIKKVPAEAKYSEPVINIPEASQKNTSQKLEVSLSGEISFKYLGEEGFQCTGGNIKGSLVYKFSHDQQLMIWVIPVTLHVDVKANGEIALTVVVDEEQEVDWEFLLTLEVDISAYIGVGCSVASVGFYGNIGTVFVLEILPEFGVDSWKIYGQMGAYAKVLWFEYKYKFTPDSWVDGYYIVEPKDKTSTDSSNAAQEVLLLSENAYMASLYLTDSYYSTDAQTLAESYQMLVIDGELYKLCYADVTGLDQYDAYNYVKLALSKWDGQAWTAPAIIDDNGLNDADYMLYRDGDKVMMVYTQQSQKMTEETVNDTYAAAQNLTIKVVELSNEMGAPVAVATPDSYAYLTQYAVVNGVPTVVWAENADNNIFGVSENNYIDNSGTSHVFATTANSVWVSRYVDGAWTEPVCLAEELSAVTQIAVNDNGYVAYIVDTNGDLSDADDRVMYYGAVEGEMSALNDVAVGSVRDVIANEERFLYYYDMVPVEDTEETDGWMTLTITESAETEAFPQDAPESFVLLYDASGDIRALLYSENKTWTEKGQKQVGSAIYGMFLENGVWGEPIEVGAYTAQNDRYVQEFAAVMADGQIVISASTVDASGEDLLYVSGRCLCEPILAVDGFEVDYAAGQVTFTVTNKGTNATDVYVTVDNGEYALISQKPLASGVSMEYTLALPNAIDAAQTVTFAMTQSGAGAVSVENISLAYSDLQVHSKQLLLGEKDVLLLAVKNTGNIMNSGITVIRYGSHDANTIVDGAIYKAVMALNLKAGEMTPFTFANENGQVETAWAVMDLVEPGAMIYHELILSETMADTFGTLVGVYTIPMAQSEPESMSENNYTCLSYDACQGVLMNGETANMSPVLSGNNLEFDREQKEDLVFEFFCGADNTVEQLMIGNTVIQPDCYSIEKLTVGGQIIIPAATLEGFRGSCTVTVLFTSGESCQMQLRILESYTVIWMDDGNILLEQTVREDMLPAFTGTLVKQPTVAWTYVFAGWDCNGDGMADPIVTPTEDVTYCAIWDAVPRVYTVTWVMTDAEGNRISVEEAYRYGDIPSYLGKVQVPAGMQHDGWDVDPMPVFADTTYTAVYASVKPVIQRIEIVNLPNKLTYTQGQTLDLAGLVVQTVMSDETKQTIPVNYLIIHSDLSEIGEATVSITYAGFQASFLVTVEEVDLSTAPTISLDSAVTAAGRVVKVAVNLENNPGIVSLRYQIVYDETALALIGVEDTGLLGGYVEPAPGIYSPYTLRWMDSKASANNSANGTIAILTFVVLEGTASGDYEISVEPIEARTWQGAKVNFYGSTAEVTVMDIILGDVDMDGEVSDWDLILLNRYLANWDGIEINLLAADVDCDGEVTDWDCILLDRYLVGWDVTFGQG